MSADIDVYTIYMAAKNRKCFTLIYDYQRKRERLIGLCFYN